MSLYDVIQVCQSDAPKWIIVIFIIMMFIQVSPIQIDPFTQIFDWLGRQLNKSLENEIVEVKSSISDLEEKVDKQGLIIEQLKTEVGDNQAMTSRYRIIRFGDEILNGQKHSQDHYDQIFVDIDLYEAYCIAHPDFVNNKGKNAVKLINATYTECIKTHDFL